MKLITVEAFFSSDTVAKALDAVNAQAETVSAMDGCERYAVYRSDAALALVQKWHSMPQFDAYRNSDVFAGLIGALKPLMSAPPVTTIANVDT
ncbi:MAG: antibiotic biosynthesis monooxygenase [Pseudomonadota bacterium]